jgi:hypothetical protein
LIFFVIFAVSVIYFEFQACMDLLKNRFPDENHRWWHLVKKAVLLRQISGYSGREYVTFLSRGSIRDSEDTDKGGEANMIKETLTETTSWRAKLSKWDRLATTTGLGLYETLAERERVYTVDDARDIRPFLTSHNWTLEKIFCRPRNSRYIAVLKGPGALTRRQLRSSFLCTVVGSFLLFFVLLAFLVYAGLGSTFTIFMVIACLIVAYPSFYSTYRLYRVGSDLIELRTMFKVPRSLQASRSAEPIPISSARPDMSHYDRDSFAVLNEESEAAYYVTHSYRITRATDRLCWIMLAVELLFVSLFCI